MRKEAWAIPIRRRRGEPRPIDWRTGEPKRRMWVPRGRRRYKPWVLGLDNLDV